jgi:hypothetical protein
MASVIAFLPEPDLDTFVHGSNGHEVLPLPAGRRERFIWANLDDIEERSITFLDKPILQTSAFHLLVGRKGVGKGTVIADTAARMTRGELGVKRTVLWIASEDSAAVDVKPRLRAAGGDPKRVHIILRGWLQLPRDIEVLRAKARELGDVGMIVIDPVSNHMSGKNSNWDSDVRDAIAPLNDLADELETVILGVRHLTEKEAKAGILAAILGGSAWVQTPRVVLAIVRDDVDSALSHYQCVIGNRLPPGTGGRLLRIEGVKLPGLEEDVTRAVWIGDSNKNIDNLMAGGTPSRSATARELILDTLEAAPELRIESDTLDAKIAGECGLSAKTVKNLRGDLKDAGLIKAMPEKDEFGEVQRWFVVRTQAPRA